MSLATPTKEGNLESLRLMLSENLVLRLFENDVRPDYYNTIGDYREPGGDVYSPAILDSQTWNFHFFAGDPVASYPEQTFEFTGPSGFVYGYYVTDRNNKMVRWAERFDVPYEVLRRGDTVFVVPRIRLPRVDEVKK